MHPRTLHARLFLLLAILMALSALSWAGFFVLSEREPRTRQFAQLLTSVVNLTRAAIVAAAPNQRRPLLNELSRQEGIVIDVAEEDEPSLPPPEDPFLRDLEQKLQETLGPKTRLAMERNGRRAIFLRVDIEGDDYWIALPRERIEHSHSLQWIGWATLAAAIAFAGAGWFVSRLTRPLRGISQAARTIGEGHHPPALPENGPEELRAVARAFNQMNADLAQLEQDRALILAGISHDLRTPLTRLRMGIEMTATDETTRDGMVADVEEMDHTIGQFLDFARAEGGEPAADMDISELVEEIAAQYRRRGTVLSVSTTPCQSSVRPKALRRAIGNLVDNAIRYGGDSPDIALTLSADKSGCTIEVADRGPGIPPEEVTRVIRPFTRLDSARSNASGAGLGLAIVDRICRQHGGALTLLAREGGGLCARVTIGRHE